MQLQNFFGESFSNNIYNYRTLTGDYVGLSSDYSQSLTVKVNVNKLKQQAEVFELHVSALNLHESRIIGSSGLKFGVLLRRMYIYSFAKAYLNGYFNSRLPQEYTGQYLLKGHSLLFNLMSFPKHTHTYENGTYVTTLINIEPSVHERNVQLLFENFPFLSDIQSQGFGGSYFFQDSTLDSSFDRLLNARVNSSSSGWSQGNIQTDDVVQSNKRANSTGNSKSCPINIVDMKASFFGNEILTTASFPFLNCYYDNNLKNIHYLIHPEMKIRSISAAISRALFLVLDNTNSPLDGVLYYKIPSNNDKVDLYTSWEVSSIIFDIVNRTPTMSDDSNFYRSRFQKRSVTKPGVPSPSDDLP